MTPNPDAEARSGRADTAGRSCRFEFHTAAGQRWHVGYDPVMATFYAQTESAGADDDLHDVASNDVGELPTVTALHAALGERVRIPHAILRQLVDHTPVHPHLSANRALELHIATRETFREALTTQQTAAHKRPPASRRALVARPQANRSR